MRSLTPQLENRTCSPRTEKNPHGNNDPAQPKINTEIEILKDKTKKIFLKR